jgi:hypothetical protein
VWCSPIPCMQCCSKLMLTSRIMLTSIMPGMHPFSWRA